MNHCNRFQTEKMTILSLLPYMENAQLISKKQKLDDLHLTQRIVDLSIVALQLFLNENLVAFDAQVGENLCQIRAYRIVHLANKWLHNPLMKHEFQIQIDNLINYQAHLKQVVADWEQAIQASKSFNKNLDGHENLTDFFARHELAFDFNEDLVFIITCYFLTHFNFKENNIPIAINLKQIACELTTSKYKAKRLSHRYQQLVCQSGCEFIMQIANELSSDYATILPSLYQIADEDRAVLPCHLVSEIIFNHAILEKIPVLLKVNRVGLSGTLHYDTIFFHLLGDDENETQFTLIPCSHNPTQYGLVVSGEVHDLERTTAETAHHYIHRILKEKPLKLILANTAIHPQYSGKRLESFRDNPFQAISSELSLRGIEKLEKKLVMMQNFALGAGCSKQNPTTFLLKHVYANTILKEINELNSLHTGCAFTIVDEKPLLLENIGQIYDQKESIPLFKSPGVASTGL